MFAFSCDIDSNDPVRSQICTCHSSAVVTCAKLWPYMIIICHIKTTHIYTRFILSADKILEKWVPSADNLFCLPQTHGLRVIPPRTTTDNVLLQRLLQSPSQPSHFHVTHTFCLYTFISFHPFNARDNCSPQNPPKKTVRKVRRYCVWENDDKPTVVSDQEIWEVWSFSC